MRTAANKPLRTPIVGLLSTKSFKAMVELERQLRWKERDDAPIVNGRRLVPIKGGRA